MPREPIPWCKPVLLGRETHYVQEALATTWISGGPFLDRLERDFAEFVGAPHALAVSSGTAALHLACLAAGLSPGDEVLVPALTFAGCAAMVVACGATPHFVDIDPATLGMDPGAAREAVGPHTRAILPAHLFGNACAMDPLLALAAERGLAVIEDCAESLGTRYRGAAVGTLGLAGCFSFQAAKTIATGEGGMVVTSRPDVAERVALLRNHGFRPGFRYWHDHVGYNYRLTNLQAALGCAQLERVSQILAARARIAATYRERLARVPGVRIPAAPEGVEAALWVQAVVLDPACFPRGREAVREAMARDGVETRPMFYPVYALPPYRAWATPCPAAETVSAWSLSLPVFETMTEAQVESVCRALAAAAG
ncbi:MAG: DegT/DnrJ/EryC1/StrS family aminotransferase [Planctomycetes bacterium]|nr:DegT/DnrJ/EryC1/StrS family aminotransferase [Planctomycetota bacterium]